MASYFHPGLFAKECAIGKGLFTNKPIKKDELVLDFTNGPGKYFNTWNAYLHEAKGSHYIIQVDDDRYLVAVDGPSTGDYINHSCEPNVGVKGSVTFVAMRDIEAGEEIAFDYCMTEAFYYYRLKCFCGAKSCRALITGSDWKRPGLQQKYRGYFSGYIQKKIDRPWILKIYHEMADPMSRFTERFGDQAAARVKPIRVRLGSLKNRILKR